MRPRENIHVFVQSKKTASYFIIAFLILEITYVNSNRSWKTIGIAFDEVAQQNAEIKQFCNTMKNEICLIIICVSLIDGFQSQLTFRRFAVLIPYCIILCHTRKVVSVLWKL